MRKKELSKGYKREKARQACGSVVQRERPGVGRGGEVSGSLTEREGAVIAQRRAAARTSCCCCSTGSCPMPARPLGDGQTEGGSGVQAGGLDDLRGGLGFAEDAVGAGDSEHVLGVVAGAIEDLGEREAIVEAVLDDVEEGQRRAVQPGSEDWVGDPGTVGT
ncbi:hypothetical protein [Streptomyces sviceus]|uniref:hypothetical protein n=1 Tax=Streptomyces sviceus TaxID=285530 RepID=UPI0036935B19